MMWLVAGLLVWSVVHLMPAVRPSLKDRVVASLGAKPYKGIFALLVLAGLIMMIVGWRASTPVGVYVPPSWGRPAAFVLMFAAVCLFGASHAKTNLKRIVRHPQLTGIVLWSVAHLLANGDTRALVLFGGLGLWALIEIPAVSRRDGPWAKPAPVPLTHDLVTLAVSAVVFAALIVLHPWFAGVSPLPVR